MLGKQSTYRKFALFVVIITLSSTATIFALDPQKQISQYGYNVWSQQNGLPANVVNVAIQTRDGYLWLGTTAGLLRFDGMRFESIGTDTANSKNREVITALCETHDGSIWIGTGFAGLRRLKDGKLLPCGPKEGFPGKPIRALFESRAGHLWIGSSDGLFEYIDGRFHSIPIDPLYITSMTEDSSGKIFIGTGKGVRIFEEARTKQINRENELPDLLITSICSDRRGNIWIGTENGLTCWSNGKIITERISNNPGLIHVTALCEDRNGNIWVGTTQGLYRFSEGKWTSFKAVQGLQSDYILWIMEDQEGSIWVCTSEGLSRFRDVNVTTYTTQEGLVNNYLTSVLETADSSMYLFSAANRGSISKLKEGKLTQIPNPPPVGPSFRARDGSIWTALSGSISQLKNDRFIRYDTTTGLPNRWISAITEDSVGLIIYLDHIGIRRFIDGRLKPYLLANGQEYLSTDYVSSFYHDPAGILWIGTSVGLVKIQNGKSTNFGTADGLADVWVNSFYDDRQGNVWMSSPRGGLTHYRNGKFIAYNTKTGLFTNEICCVLVDDQGDVWLSSPRGIGRINHKAIEDYERGLIDVITSQTFTTADGMRTDECFSGWQPSAWKAHDGRLWFATVKGAVMIDPKTFKRNEAPPPVYIEQFIADMQTIRLEQSKLLRAGTGKLEFHYTALSYLVPERVFFKYLLEGYDREWVDAGTRRVAFYTNLPPGRYRFRVVACNNDGVWNETGASYSFELAPHFYQTYWFLALIILLIAGAGFGAYRLRVWQLLQREKELKKSIDEALAKIRILGGLIPICANCKKIRDDKGYWDHLEGYIQTHSEAKFSHGICPDCAKKIYPGLSDKIK
jgi:ligand-binding sensor domain-containing protein